MAEVGGQTDRVARRETLSAAIVDGFETLGWKWSDDQLLDGVRDIFAIESGYPYLDSDRVRQTLRRTFGESQVVPRDGALLPLAKSFCTTIQEAVLDGCYPFADKRLATSLINPLFDTELRGIIDSEDLFPVRFDPTNELWFKMWAALTRQLRVVTKACSISTEFNTVLWVVARAANSVLEMEHGVNCAVYRAQQCGQRYIDHDKMHRLKEPACQVVRGELRERLARLPMELRKVVFVHLIGDSFINVWDLDCLDPHVSYWTKVFLEMLSDIEFVPKFQDLYGQEYSRQPYRFTNMPEVTETFGEEVKEVVMNTMLIENYIILRRDAHFSVPSTVGNGARHVRHLDLFVELSTPYSTRQYYPSSLYTMQDRLPDLKRWFPGLKTAEVRLVDECHDDVNTKVLKKDRSGDFTTKEAEIAVLVDCLLQSKVEETWFRYENCKGSCAFEARFMASGEQETSVTALVSTAMDHELRGVAMQVRSVGSGVGDLNAAVEAWRKQRYEDE